MNKTASFHKNLTIFGVPLMLLGMVMLLTKSSFFSSYQDTLSIGITFDLLLTIPFIYFLLIRNTNIPKTTIIPVLIAGMIVGTIILPPQSQYYLNLFKTWVLPIVEISIISFVIYKVRQTIKGFKVNQNPSLDFYSTLKNTCYEILPKSLVIPVVTEIAVFYYGFIHWKKRTLNENEFSYHRESGTVSLLIAIILIVLIETFVIHMLLIKWSELAAWILTFLSIYSGLQLFGFLKSLYNRPISIEDNRLYLRYGIMSETTIELAKINSVKISSRDFDFNKEIRCFSFLGKLESHNVIIFLKEENSMSGLYGVKRSYSTLALHVDDKVRFVDRINKYIQQRQ